MSDEFDDRAVPSGLTEQTPADSLSEAPGGLDEPTDVSAGGMVPRAELEKVIRERQAAKQRARRAEDELTALQSHVVTDPEGSDDERRRLQQTLRDRESQLGALLRDDQLRAAAARAGAINPDQVVAILRSRVAMEAAGDGGLAPVFLDTRGRPELISDGTATDVDTFVGGFLAEASNANLLRPSSAPGSGARPVGPLASDGGLPRTLAEFNALPADRRRDAAMLMDRPQREAMLGIARPGEDGYL